MNVQGDLFGCWGVLAIDDVTSSASLAGIGLNLISFGGQCLGHVDGARRSALHAERNDYCRMNLGDRQFRSFLGNKILP